MRALIRQKSYCLGVFTLFFLITAGMLSAQDTVSKASNSFPGDVSEEVGKVLGSESFLIQIGGAKVAEFWIRKEIPLKGTPAGAFGLNFEQLKLGTLVGVVQLHEDWKDYKAMAIPAGVYTMRYGQEPADGAHMGVSTYRDFVLLIPAAKDASLDAEFNFDRLNEQSVLASGTNHPAVMAIYPIWDEVAEPSLVENELGQTTFVFKQGDLVIGLVVKGHGES